MPSFSTAKRISLTASLTFWVTPSSCGCAFFRYSTITPSLGLSPVPLCKCLAHLCGRIHSLAIRRLPSVKPPVPLRHHDVRFLAVRFVNPPRRRQSLRWDLVPGVADRFGPFLQVKFADAASRLRGEAVVGVGSTAFRWAHASWDNAELSIPSTAPRSEVYGA